MKPIRRLMLVLSLPRLIHTMAKEEKSVARQHDQSKPKHITPPVYEADEQLRLTVALTVSGSGIGLIAAGLKQIPGSDLSNGFFIFVGMFVLFEALYYVASTATRLRYMDPGSAHVWYLSEHGRRQSYDRMVDFFWVGLLSTILFFMSELIGHIGSNYRTWAVVAAVSLLIFFHAHSNTKKGKKKDRESGNLEYGVDSHVSNYVERLDMPDSGPTVRSNEL